MTTAATEATWAAVVLEIVSLVFVWAPATAPVAFETYATVPFAAVGEVTF